MQPEPNFWRIRRWYDALRSGYFHQGTGQLVVEPDDRVPVTRHCCLGVAVEIARIGFSGHPPISTLTIPSSELSWHDMGVLPSEVTAWFGFASDSPVLDLSSEEADHLGWDEELASELNDTHNYDFNQIAEAIALTWPEILNEVYAS